MRRCLVLLGMLASCRERLPEPERKGEISGHIEYAGPAEFASAPYMLEIAAFFIFPPIGPPHGKLAIPMPNLGAKIEYQLRGLPDSRYYLLAQVVDATEQAVPRTAIVQGAYPDECALGEPSGPVEVTADRPATDIDIVLHEHGGADDPCFQSTDACPEPGRSSLVLEVAAPEGAIRGGDQVTVAMFTMWPPAGPPRRTRVIPGGEVRFPLSIVLNDLEAQDYAIAVCLDRGSDNANRACGEEDSLGVFEGGALVSFTEDTVVRLALDVRTQSSQRLGTDTAASLGCAAGGRDGGMD